MAGNFRYEIVKKIAVLSENGEESKELNLISYNGAPPKYDIRRWGHLDGGGEKMLKGITLDDEEIQLLKQALDELDL